MAETTHRTRPLEFLSDVAEQVRKVTWPDREQLRNSTWVIIVFMFIVATLIFIMDFGLRVALDLITSLFSG